MKRTRLKNMLFCVFVVELLCLFCCQQPLTAIAAALLVVVLALRINEKDVDAIS